MGRTQLQDAVPIRLGQEFASYAAAVGRDIRRMETAAGEMRTVNLDPFAAVSGSVKACAVTLSKIASDLRLMSSGPRTGLGEILLPGKQNGSSIMPGKVNPVIPEVVNQAAFQIFGNDVTITLAAESGQLELNAFEPVIFYNLFQAVDLLGHAAATFTDNCICGIQADAARCKAMVENSVGTATALCPYLGYTKAAEIAKKAVRENRNLRELVLEERLMDEEELDRVLDSYAMTEPGRHKSEGAILND